ncbi:hypothetical protein BN4901_0442 [Citrobacter europaeus]|uniref:Uncharacterized protein n=1 Tax=Citrobacter europaeus TaxID=1914243 RepID=A0ABY0JWH7_9ENTR|nr:hypothetical protein CIP106467_4804 [Citrobacter europaeus]SCA74577.1 hypothetical protein BN4901_0442 [Citrobacter europaeus]
MRVVYIFWQFFACSFDQTIHSVNSRDTKAKICLNGFC